MKLHQADTAGLNIVTAYGSDYVAINHQRYVSNVVVMPQDLIVDWTSATPETVGDGDLAQLRSLEVGIVLLGTGRQLRFPAASLLKTFGEAGIGIEIMDLQAACRTYNILAAEGRKVAAALLFD